MPERSGLQLFKGYERFHRDTRCAVAVRIGRLAVCVADGENVDRLQRIGQMEFPGEHVGLEIADSSGTQSQLRRRQHHVVGQDGRVDVAGVFLVERAHPCPAVVGADDDGARRAVNIGGF